MPRPVPPTENSALVIPTSPRPILDVTGALGLDTRDVTVWGEGKAKVSLDALARSEPTGRLILVSAMTPTPAGEGKTTTTIGLAQGLAMVGVRTQS